MNNFSQKSIVSLNKIKFIAAIAAFILFAILFSAFKEKNVPAEQVKALCLENTKLYQAQLDTLQQFAEAKKPATDLINRLKLARIAFKRIEYMVEYIYNARYAFFNGVNAVEMEEGGIDPNAKPEGMQVIESELFNDSIDYKNITFLTKQLKYRTLSFYLVLRDVPLQDAYIFEALRFNLIRIEALGLVSFDSPNIRNNVPEIIAALSTVKTVLEYYKEDKTSLNFDTLYQLLTKTIAYLQNQSFTTLDRLLFVKNYLQPITKKIIAFQQERAIPYMDENSTIIRAVNLRVPTIYDTAFLNVRFYAQDKYYKNNPLYATLGKLLFFDTRLSADGKLSCATCHKPTKVFMDGLPTSITNKTGEFQQRNTPTLLNAPFQAAYFYDLDATSLETQVNHVVINPKEYNHNFDSIINRLKNDTVYVRLFSEAFPEYKKDAIAISTINTCIADYERKFIFLNSAFDKYMRGETNKIGASVKRGFNLFMGKAQCGSCHFAPTFFGTAPPFYGISESEVLGTTTTFDTIHPKLDEDIGRYKNFALPEFKYSIKTSTVRNAELTAPYMHNGGFKTLEEVIEFYDHGGGVGLGLDVPNQTLPSNRLNLSNQDKKDIITFIKALTDTAGINRLF